ncbi:unnamed protein product, partial [Staurois parvus]
QLIHALVISRLHSCNSLLTGLTITQAIPLQSIMNAAARLRSDCCLSLPLHWLPLSVLHPSLPIPPWPPLSVLHPSANPSVSSTPLCQSLHWLPLSVLHPLCQSLHWPPL